jgi:G6PDH family F420-dependent oxidoreductase
MASTNQFGLALSSEEHSPRRLIDIARLAEAAGFEFVSVSVHVHPWIDAQGHSPFVWSIVGAIAEATAIDVAIGVTCPIMRIHPAVLAHATATCAELLGQRFTWGVGTGEALNEHVLGDRWPPVDLRLEMLDEAVDIVRRMWTGEQLTHRGAHFTVENARVYDRPDRTPPVIVSAFGPAAAAVAARIGDGLWLSGAATDTIEVWRAHGGRGPVYAQLTLCWARDRDAAIDTAHRIWPNTGVPGQLSQDLPTPAHFEQASSIVTKDQIAASMACGPDPEPVLDAIQEMVTAGVDHVYLHQIGPDQEGFCRFWRDELADAARAMTP